MQHARDFNAVRHDAVEDEVAAHGKASETSAEIVPRRSHPRVGGIELELRIDFSKHAIRGVAAVAGDVMPDLAVVLLRQFRAANQRHQPCSLSRRARSSAMIFSASKSLNSPRSNCSTPLAN